mmetsp:Transcript_24463/g.72754  ORF Transcript_24463/g.72754 Transcript_24463/m.72754 type:complete len:113 (-) Transcript_24463:336-674(-)
MPWGMLCGKPWGALCGPPSGGMPCGPPCGMPHGTPGCVGTGCIAAAAGCMPGWAGTCCIIPIACGMPGGAGNGGCGVPGAENMFTGCRCGSGGSSEPVGEAQGRGDPTDDTV